MLRSIGRNSSSFIAPDIELSHLQFAEKANQLLEGDHHQNRCLPGTRVAILDALIHWANGGVQLPSSPSYLHDIYQGKQILWLCGVAGSGKSSIATSVALEGQAKGFLGSCYCFRSGSQAHLNPSNLFSTIAYHLASHNRSSEDHLVNIVRACDLATVKSTSPSVQLNTFLLPLLHDLDASSSTSLFTLIIIDALDESGSIGERRGILKCLAELGSQLPPTIRILITSRFEVDVQNTIHP
ncbi:hypothetical protein DL93DRAFT_2217730, partial [Clavulina sp. PMI_390]